jgi:hypothetical protein
MINTCAKAQEAMRGQEHGDLLLKRPAQRAASQPCSTTTSLVQPSENPRQMTGHELCQATAQVRTSRIVIWFNRIEKYLDLID